MDINRTSTSLPRKLPVGIQSFEKLRNGDVKPSLPACVPSLPIFHTS